MKTLLTIATKRQIKSLLFLFTFFSIQLVYATEFFDDFEATNVNTVATFNLDDNGIIATLEGGTAFTIGNGLLYNSGSKSWMVEPEGTNSRGTHSGSATITFDMPMSRISFFVRSETTQVVSTVTLIDISGNIAENSAVTNIVSAEWTEVNFTITTGATPLQGLRIEVMGAGGMAALDDLGGSSIDDVGTDIPPPVPEASGNNSGGGSLGLLIFMLVVLRRKLTS